MADILEGQRFWKVGDRHHVWIVDAVVTEDHDRAPFAILLSEDLQSTEDVDLSHLLNTEIYVPVADEPKAKAGPAKI